MFRRGTVFFLIIIAACTALLWILASYGYPTQIEICEPSGGTEKCSYHYIPVGIIRWVLLQLDRYGVLITAVATVFIAWFTWTLRRSTEKLWLAPLVKLFFLSDPGSSLTTLILTIGKACPKCWAQNLRLSLG